MMIPNLEDGEDGEAVGRGLEILGDHRHRLVAEETRLFRNPSPCGEVRRE